MAAKTTVRVSLTNNAAKDDSFSDADYDWLTEDGGLVGDINVLGNDPGSATLIGVSDSEPVVQSELTQYSDIITTDATGADLPGNIYIHKNADGTVAFDASALESGLQYLDDGETVEITFYYTAQMANGAYSTAKVTITITGENDAPTVSATATAGFTEAADASAQDLSDSGTVSFDDVDATDVVDISFASNGDIAWSGGTIDAGLAAVLVAGFDVTTVTDAAAPGATPWSYSADDVDLDFLAAGETITFSYTVTATDNNGATGTTQVSFTITGSNDAPDITGTAVSADRTETDTTLTATGTLNVVDADLSDTVTVTVDSVAVDPASTFAGTNPLTNGDLLAMMAVSPTTALNADPSAGTDFDWTFTSGSSGDGAFNFLAAGETLVLNYTLKGTDDSGVVLNDNDTQVVTITITGTNDAPDITGTAVSADRTETDTTLTATGTLNVVDADLSDTVTVTVDSVAVDPASTFAGTNPLTNGDLLAMMAVSPTTALNADPSAGTDFDWTFTSGSSGDGAFNFLAAGETLVLNYTLKGTDDSGVVLNDNDTQVVTITITGTNDAPVIDVDGVASYTVGGAAAVIDSTIGITDVDSTSISGAQVEITGNFQAGDVLNFVNTAEISGSYTAATGVLILSGTATLAQYEAALESITFSSSSTSTLTRTVSFQVTDSGGASSAADTATVNVSPPANQAPDANNDVWVFSNGTTIAAGIIPATWFTHNDTDPDGDPIFVTAVSGLPAGLTANFDGAGHLIDITGTTPVAGTYNLTYTLSDGSLTDMASVTMTVVATTNSGTDIITLDGNDFSYIDALSGNDTVTGDAILTGNAGIDTFIGSAGNDILSGGDGDDKLFGVGNNDTLNGGAGNDLLDGGNNDDFLDGGSGNNILTGGAGNDTFFFQNLALTTNHVTDFNAGSPSNSTDKLRFDVGLGGSPQFSVGDNDTTVENFKSGNNGTINAAGTEVAVKTDASVTNATVQGTIDGYGAITTGALFVFLNDDLGHAAVYYDANPSAAGGAVLVAELDNITTLGGLANFNAGDFEFV